jgi:hypothetical protein
MTGTYARRVPGKAADIANLAIVIDPMSVRQPALAKVLTLAIRLDAAVGLLSFDSIKLRELRLACQRAQPPDALERRRVGIEESDAIGRERRRIVAKQFERIQSAYWPGVDTRNPLCAN